MSQNNGNKKDRDLADAEASGDFAMKRLNQAIKIYDQRKPLILKRDCRDELIEAQQQVIQGLSNTLNEYAVRFGDIEILAEVEVLSEVKPNEYVEGLEKLILWLAGGERRMAEKLPDLQNEKYMTMEQSTLRVVAAIKQKNFAKDKEVKPNEQKEPKNNLA